MVVEIFGYPHSNFTLTTLMVAHEKGVEYKLVPTQPHSDEAKEIHPFGFIPIMRHDGLQLYEAQAITRYIDDAFDGPNLIPAEPRGGAVINQWISLLASNIDRLLVRQYAVQYLYNKGGDGNPIRTEIDVAIKRFRRVFATLETGVSEGCLGGKNFTMADCFLLPMTKLMPMFPESKEYFEKSPNLMAYVERHSQRPSYLETSGD